MKYYRPYHLVDSAAWPFGGLFRAFFSSWGHPIYALWLYLVNDVGGIICRDYNGSLMAGCCSRVHFLGKHNTIVKRGDKIWHDFVYSL